MTSVSLSLIRVFSNPTLHSLHCSLQAFSDAYIKKHKSDTDAQHARLCKEWTIDMLSEALSAATTANPEDAATLIKIAKLYKDNIFDERCAILILVVNAM